MENAYFDEEDDKNIKAHVFSQFLHRYSDKSPEDQDKGVKRLAKDFGISEDDVKKYAEEYYYGNKKK